MSTNWLLISWGNFTIGISKDRQITSFFECIPFDNSLEDYTHEIKRLYSQLRDGISIRAEAYLYIGGLQNGLLRIDLIATWEY